jgi:hypothetical protein
MQRFLLKVMPEIARIQSILAHSLNAFSADILAVVGEQIVGRCAKYAGRLILLQNDSVAFHVNLQLVPFSNIQSSSQFDWEHNSAEFIHLADNTGRFHG